MILDPESPHFTAAVFGEGAPEHLTAFQEALKENPALQREAAGLQQTARLLSTALKSPPLRPISPLPRPVPVPLSVCVSGRKKAVRPRRRHRSARSPRWLSAAAAAAVIGLTALVLSLLHGISASADRALPALASEMSAPPAPVQPALAAVNVTAPSASAQAPVSSRPASGSFPPARPLLSSADLPAGSWIAGPVSPPVTLSAPPPEVSFPAPAPEASAPLRPGMYASPPIPRP